MSITIPVSAADMPLTEWLSAIREIAAEAGAITMRHYQPGGFEGAEAKGDGSPVTAADREAEAAITPRLKALTPNIPVIGEEAADAGTLPSIGQGPFWLVDPLDGTKEFIKGSGEFTVNIALIVSGRPLLGVVLAPAIDEEYGGCGIGTAFQRIGSRGDEEISVTDPVPAALRIVASRSHRNDDALDAFMKGREIGEVVCRGSSLKFCDVAAGRADIYPRFGPTCEWDTAAGHAVLEAAGGYVTDETGGLFPYGKVERKFLNTGFIAWGGAEAGDWFPA
jgi:3'(2'), 5'-bisphosphate nucleotidase